MDKEERKYVREFCTEIAAARRCLGFTREQFAQQMGESPAWIAAIEHAAILPDFSMRQKLRLALDAVMSTRGSKPIGGRTAHE